MKNEKKQKKEYAAPKMKTVKVRQQSNLLSCSDPNDTNCGLEAN